MRVCGFGRETPRPVEDVCGIDFEQARPHVERSRCAARKIASAGKQFEQQSEPGRSNQHHPRAIERVDDFGHIEIQHILGKTFVL